MIEKLRAERKPPADMGRRLADGLQISSLARPPLRQTARELLVWFSLEGPEDARDKEELRKAKDANKRKGLSERLGKKKRLGLEFQHEDDEFKADEEAVRAEIGKVEGVIKAGGARPKVELGNRKELIPKLAELRVLRAHETQEVSPANLDRFEAALPPWAREGLDGLPPEAAKRRLKVLYRLVFPEGQEIPAPKPKVAPKAPSRPAPPANGPAEATPF